MYNCPKCGNDVDSEVAFCPNCGCNLKQELILDPICPKCLKKYEAGSRFCTECGVSLVSTEDMIPRCRICGKVYEDGSKYCPEDGGEIVAPALVDNQKFSTEETSELASRLINEGYGIDISSLIRRGWELLTKDIGLHILLLLILTVVTSILAAIPVVHIFLGIIIAPFAAGPMIIALKRAQGKEPKFEDGFLGLERFLPLALVGLVSGIMVFLGTILLIIPGIYLSVAYTLAIPLVIDRNMPFWEAMETSRKVITKKWFSVFGLILILAIINILGCIPMGLGLVITLPLTTTTIIALYEAVFGHKGRLPVKGNVLGSVGASK